MMNVGNRKPPRGPVRPRKPMPPPLPRTPLPGQDEIRTARNGGMMSSMKKGGSVKSSASRRADGIAKKGKTRGKFV